MLAVKHPISVFHDLFAGTDKKLVYVAHPITEIRRLRRGTENQKQMAEDIVERIQDLCRRLREHFIVFEPTAIDELRFDLTFELDKQSMDLPYLGQRWPLPSVETSDLLCEKPENLEDAFGKEWMRIGNAIAQNESETLGQGQGEMVRRAWPSLAALQEQILQQITSRDFTLVKQANGLAVYRPVFRGHASGGVEREIKHHQTLHQAGQKKATVVILHPESDEHDSLLENFKRLVKYWNSEGKLDGEPEQFASLEATLTFEQLQPIQDGETDLIKGQAISALLRQWEIEFLTRPPRAMAPDPAAVAREEESERGSLFTGLESYISGLVDVEVIRENLSIQEFSLRVVNRINDN